MEIVIDFYRKYIEWQFTPEMDWSNTEVDHVKPICMFGISDKKQLKEALIWRNTQSLFEQIHKQKGNKNNFVNYSLQLIKFYKFLKLNEEGSNQDFHR